MAGATDIVQQLPQLEALCERLYKSQDPQERAQAEQILRVFGQTTEYIAHCKAILDNSRSGYAQLFASASLIKVVTEHTISVPVKLEMRNYFISYLDSRGTQLEGYVITSLVQLLCRTTKLCWFDDDHFRTIVEDAKAFLTKGTGGSPGHYLLGLKILNMLVVEFNQPTPGRTMTQHRKPAVAFRDTALFKVFQTAITSLQLLQSNAAADEKLREQAVSLALQCLSFDFVGTCLDESSEDLGTIQVPSTWRPVIEDPTTLQLFLDFYAASKPPLSSMALECLVRLASVRRSLFVSDTERSKFLNHLVTGTRDILRLQQGLSEHNNYHEFCRLLGRLKTNYQLSELVNVDKYNEWIQLVAELTVNSLNSWQWASNSVYYLLGLWSRLVSSMPYLKGESPSLLETYVPKITEAYLTSRLDSVRAVLANGIAEDPLESEEQLQEQMDSLPYMCRFQYEYAVELIVGRMDPIVVAYQKAGTEGTVDSTSVALLEGQLTWLTHIIGAILRGRLNQSSIDTQETIDGDLAVRVFGLLRMVDSGFHQSRYGERSRQRLDIAILSFFQSFRKVYVGEQVMHSSKVYVRLSERLGLSDHLLVLNVMLSKIATNLKVYGSCDEVITLTLGLFQDLAAGYMSGKLLLKLDATAFILQHHTAEHFAFMDDPANSRSRSSFYCTLAKLLFMEDTPAKWKSFVAPLQQVLMGIASAASGGAMAFRHTVQRQTVIGLLRDLRGIAQATSSKRTYSLLFEWLYPAHLPTLLSCLEAWADSPDVTTAMLKFMAEFALNKQQRLTFDSSSPNGILLFREVSKVLVTYGSRVVTAGPTSDPYGQKYKGIWICLELLKRGLAGNYVNFGVFELYGDPALKDALDVTMKMALSIPLVDIMAYRKVSKAFFGLLEVLCANHTGVIAACDTPTFAFLMTALDAGLKSLDVVVSSQCAAAVDNLAGFYFKAIQASNGSPPPAAPQAFAEHLRQRPELLPTLLTTLFEIVLFEDCSNQWSLSRPMLALILVNEQIYTALRNRIVAAQPLDRQAHLSQCLDKLMADVQRNLEPKNRDKFTQNLTNVRHEFRSKV
ncbi:g1925 [Coccomyxa elongata]